MGKTQKKYRSFDEDVKKGQKRNKETMYLLDVDDEEETDWMSKVAKKNKGKKEKIIFKKN